MGGKRVNDAWTVVPRGRASQCRYFPVHYISETQRGAIAKFVRWWEIDEEISESHAWDLWFGHFYLGKPDGETVYSEGWELVKIHIEKGWEG